MKALTLTQPWATLVARGEKQIETRSWRTDYRGPLAIHAGKGLAGATEQMLTMLVQRAPFYRALGAGRVEDIVAGLPRGAVVAVGVLVNVELIAEATIRSIGRSSNEYAFGDYSLGRYAWFLEDVQPLPEPVPARGMQLLWDWTP